MHACGRPRRGRDGGRREHAGEPDEARERAGKSGGAGFTGLIGRGDRAGVWET